MKIIAVMTQKGGVGKTMTASSLAYILGVEHGKRVLIADADQQGNISMLYGRFEPQGIGMSELLEKHRAIGGTYSTEQLIDETPYQNISIIPANGFLMRTNMTLLLLEQDNQILRFKAQKKADFSQHFRGGRKVQTFRVKNAVSGCRFTPGKAFARAALRAEEAPHPSPLQG